VAGSVGVTHALVTVDNQMRLVRMAYPTAAPATAAPPPTAVTGTAAAVAATSAVAATGTAADASGGGAGTDGDGASDDDDDGAQVAALDPATGLSTAVLQVRRMEMTRQPGVVTVVATNSMQRVGVGVGVGGGRHGRGVADNQLIVADAKGVIVVYVAWVAAWCGWVGAQMLTVDATPTLHTPHPTRPHHRSRTLV